MSGLELGAVTGLRVPLLVGAGVALAAALSPAARREGLTWGATPEEALCPLPGDDLLPDADLLSTRAVTIDADKSVVWPWLVQMGSGRGGAYSYDWIENLLGHDVHSTYEILPEFQHLAVGDVVPLGPKGPGMRVEICDPEHSLVFRSTDGTWVWAFDLRTYWLGTRLVSRNRIAAPRFVDRALLEPGSLLMERRMLLGIKQRAESAAPGYPATPGAGR